MVKRRGVLAGLTFVSGGGAACGVASAQPAGNVTPPMPMMPGMSPGAMTAQSCIESCWRTHIMCLETARYCLEQGGMHAMPAHLVLLADCAEICQATAKALIRRSTQHAVFCNASAEIGDACALQCEVFAGDPRMMVCARACRDCANHCREMSRLPI